MLRNLLRSDGHTIGHMRVRTLMTRMGIEALYRKPTTSQRYPAHRVYPYLLHHLEISRSNHVWAADITYIPMHRGFVYLFAVLDWASRRVLAWRLSNTLTTDFCLEVVQEAVTRWYAGDLQHRSRQPRIYRAHQGARHTYQYGRPGLLAGQCVRGTTVEDCEIRGGVSVHLRDHLRSPTGIRALLTFCNQIRPHTGWSVR